MVLAFRLVGEFTTLVVVSATCILLLAKYTCDAIMHLCLFLSCQRSLVSGINLVSKSFVYIYKNG